MNQKLIAFIFASLSIILMNIYHPQGFSLARCLIAFGLYIVLRKSFELIIKKVKR